MTGEDKRSFHSRATPLHRYAPAALTLFVGVALSVLSFAVAGRQWLVVCAPTPGFVAAGRTWYPWSVLAAALVLTGLLMSYLLSSIRRARRTERLVAALSEANQKLKTEVAERKQVEERLRLLSSAVEQSSEGLAISDIDGDLLYVNEAFAAMHGYNPEELTGKHLSIFHTFEQMPEVQVANRQLRQTGDFAGEIWHCRRDGTAFPALMHNSLLRDEAGNPIGMIGTLRDITQRKQVENTLQRYRRAIEESPELIAATDPDYVCVLVNRTFLHYYNLDESDVIGHPVGEVVGAEIFEKHIRPRLHRSLAGETLQFELKYPFPEIGERDILASHHPLKGPGGEVTGVVFVGRDITERKQAEKALRDNEGKLNAMLQSLGDHISMMDKDLNIIWANETARKRFGDDIVGRKCYEVYHSRKQPCEPYPCLTLKAFQDGKIHEHDTQVIDKNGKMVYFHCTANVALRDGGGKPTAVIEVSRDITERKLAEERLRDYAERLGSLNAELERSNRDLQDFTYTVSHDLQEPLRKIHTFTEFLMDDCGEQLPEQGLQHLRRVQDAAVRMKNLIQHLLALARVGTRGGELIPVEPRQVIDKVIADMSERVRECGAEVSVEEELPRVMADAVQLGQVFQNLIGNALKFRSPDRTPKVTLAACVEGDQAIFSVTDNGIGIEEESLEKIFVVFQRLHPREEYEGAGVGLALCKKIVQRHGGRIWAESEVGKGSTFRFTLHTAPMRKEGKP